MPPSVDALPTFARRLKQARLHADLSQRELGILAGLEPHVASPRINQYERGKHEPKLQTAERLAEVLGVRPPVVLDVRQPDWPVAAGGAGWDAIYVANLLHISPWACAPALMQGAARHLARGGRLVTYGPYLEDDVATAPSNLAFDADLRSRDPA